MRYRKADTKVHRHAELSSPERRKLLQQGFLSLLAVSGGSLLPACGGGSGGSSDDSVPGSGSDNGGSDGGSGGNTSPKIVSNIGNLGPLKSEPDANGFLFPEASSDEFPNGFSSRELARTGEYPPITGSAAELPQTTGAYIWHERPDGGAVFETPQGGWIYVSNSEMPPGQGGVGALEFDANGDVIGAFALLTGSSVNCAGGKTPWGTWLSCEEFDEGVVWECFPLDRGNTEPVRHSAMGVFYHEAAVVDPSTGIVYMTEDREDSCFYRFIPDVAGDLSAGRLQAAVVDATGNDGFAREGGVTWLDIDNPDPLVLGTTLRDWAQQRGAAKFARGEGAWFHNGVAYFATTRDNVIWAYQPAGPNDGDLFQIFNTSAGLFPNDTTLSGVDNLTVSMGGDVLVAEDGGGDALQVQAITPDGRLVPLLTLLGQNGDQGKGELAGIAFDPSGTRLYVSSQKGTPEDFATFGRLIGRTYEIKGPFVVTEK